MKSNPLISIIVPIYKVEKYLERCVESLLNQTYTNLEIILVDDGSPDNCPVMCEEFAKKDSRIRVVHKKNGGLSDARNVGLEVATGEYIGFIDSDDYVDVNMYQDMITNALKYNAQIVECDIYSVYDGNRIEEYSSVDDAVYTTTKDIMYAYIAKFTIKTVVWNKLYKKDIFGSLKFEVGKYNEDEFFTYQILSKATTFVHINKHYYYYIQRAESIMGCSYSLKKLDGLEGGMKKTEFIKEYYPELYFYQLRAVTFFCIYNYQKILKNPSCDKDKIGRKRIEMYRKQLVWSNDDIKKLNTKEKIYVLLSSFSINLCAKLRNMIGSGVL